jgi:two-component system NtrC family sensor kinase
MSATPDSTLTDPKDHLIADLRRRLAECAAERDEALAQQMATAEVLQVINSSPGDLTPVFDGILEKAHALCGAEIGSLTIYDGEKNRAVATRGLAPGLADQLRQGFQPGPAHPIRELLSGARIVQVPDVGETADPIARASFDAGIRTSLYVPLRKDDRLLGLIVASRQEVRLFSDKEITLLENFAAQAVIAMENARLLIETREALEQQTATAEVLQVINSSPGDLAPVFDAMLDKALHLCEAAFGVLWTYEGEVMRPAASRGMPLEFVEFFKQGAHKPGAHPQQRLLRGERFVQVADLAGSERYRSGEPLTRAVVDLGGVRTILLVPLHSDTVVLGHFGIYRREARPFSDKQIALLESFAAQAVIAMENARLLGELRQRTDDLEESLEYQTATSDVLQIISRSTFELQPVLDTVCETAGRLCAADMAAIATRQGEVYRYVATFSLTPSYDALLRQLSFTPGRETVTGRTLLERRAVQVPDLAADPEITLTEAVTVGKFRTMLGVPLLREGEPVGVIGLTRQHVQPFTDKQIELVTTFADQAVIAMENARLLTETREALEQQTATAEVLGSSIHRPAISRRCSTQCSKRRRDCARHPLASSGLGMVSAFTLVPCVASRSFAIGSGSVILSDRTVTVPPSGEL